MVQVGQTARLDIVMEVGSVTQSVEVTGTLPVLQSENAAVGQVIATTAVQQLPLNGRNMTQPAIITPGVTGLNYAPTGTIGSEYGRTNCAPAVRLSEPTAPGIAQISCSWMVSIIRR